MKRTILVAIFSASVAMSGFAQNQNSCSPAGAWYGGSEGTVKYLGSITPIDGSTYTLLFDGAYSTKDIGFPVKTIFAGTFKAQKYGEYLFEGSGGGLANPSDAMPPKTGPAILVVHFRMRFEDCNTLKFDYDFFGGYFMGNGKVPFVDVPDFFPAPVPIHETYKRLPINCPLCTNQF